MVAGLKSYEYIMNRTGTVKKLKRLLSLDQYEQTCCAFYTVTTCITDFFMEHCSLVAETNKQKDEVLEFFLKAINLSECHVSKCSFVPKLQTTSVLFLLFIFSHFTINWTLISRSNIGSRKVSVMEIYTLPVHPRCFPTMSTEWRLFSQ